MARRTIGTFPVVSTERAYEWQIYHLNLVLHGSRNSICPSHHQNVPREFVHSMPFIKANVFNPFPLNFPHLKTINECHPEFQWATSIPMNFRAELKCSKVIT